MSFILKSVPLFKILIFISIIYYFGFFYGISISLALHKFHMFLMQKIFNMIPLAPGDLNFVWMDDKDRYNLVVFMVFDNENFDAEMIKNLLIDRGIKKFQKLRSRLRFKFFEFYWEEVSEKEATKTIQIIRNNDKYLFDSNEDITKFSYTEIAKRIDILDEFPFKFLIVHNDKAKIRNTLLIKFDHSFSDGLGLIGLICGLADNYSLDLFPGNMNKKNSILGFIFTILLFPYLAIYSMYRNIYSISTKESPFKISYDKKKGQPRIQMTGLLNFEKISKICKKLKITFNDMIMSIISSASKKFMEKKGLKKPKHLSCMVPITSRKPPKTIEEIMITNDSTAIGCKIDLIENPLENCLIIREEFSKHVRNPYLFLFTKILIDSFFKFLPCYVMKEIILANSRGIDFTISNVPGPKSALYYSGCKVRELICFTSTGFLSSFLAVFSYNGTYRFVICFDEALDLDIEEYKRIILKEVEFIMEKSNELIKND